MSIPFATSAAATPYAAPTELAINTSAPAVGAAVSVSTANVGSHVLVTFTLHTKPYLLGTAESDAAGHVSATFRLPAGFAGEHTIVATNPAGRTLATVAITIGGTAARGIGQSDQPGRATPAYTGVAVAGIGMLGVIMLAAGGILIHAGRRRKITT